MSADTPVVMCIADHDPCGGSGISADIEAVAAIGCHCTPVISAINVQDTLDIKDSILIDSTILMEQMRAVLEDMDVAAIKVHQLTSTRHIETVHSVLTDYQGCPVVVDPALGPLQLDDDFSDALRTLLLPQATLAVLTEQEAFALAPGSDSLAACAHQLLEYDCRAILITDSQNKGSQLTSRLFSENGLHRSFTWQSLPHNFLGAGSTFAAAITAYIAHGQALVDAIENAQKFTWQTLYTAKRLGMGKLIPNRMNRRNH